MLNQDILQYEVMDMTNGLATDPYDYGIEGKYARQLQNMQIRKGKAVTRFSIASLPCNASMPASVTGAIVAMMNKSGTGDIWMALNSGASSSSGIFKISDEATSAVTSVMLASAWSAEAVDYRTCFAEFGNSMYWSTVNANTSISLGRSGTNVTFVSGAPAMVVWLVAFADRLWAVSTDNRIYYSAAADGTSWSLSAQYISFANQTKQKITGCVVWQGSLYVFTKYDLFRISGTSPTDFRLDRMNIGVGCLGFKFCAAASEGLYFIGNHGAYLWNGSLVEISRPIRDYFENQDNAFLGPPDLNYGVAKGNGAIIVHNNKLFCALPHGTSGGAAQYANIILIFDLELKAWFGPFTAGEDRLTSINCFLEDFYVFNNFLLMGGSNTPTIAKYVEEITADSYASFTDGYSALPSQIYESPWLSFGNMENKQFREFEISLQNYYVQGVVSDSVSAGTQLGTTSIAGAAYKGQVFKTSASFNKLQYFDVSMTTAALASAVCSCTVYAENGSGLPSGASLGGTTIAAFNGGSVYADHRFTFATPITLSPATKYCLVFSSSDTYNFNFSTDTTGYPDGTEIQSSDSGGTWSALAWNLFFTIYNYPGNTPVVQIQSRHKGQPASTVTSTYNLTASTNSDAMRTWLVDLGPEQEGEEFKLTLTYTPSAADRMIIYRWAVRYKPLEQRPIGVTAGVVVA